MTTLIFLLGFKVSYLVLVVVLQCLILFHLFYRQYFLDLLLLSNKWTPINSPY